MPRFACLALLSLTLLPAAVCLAAPQVAVPVCATPPVMDGALSPGEWDAACGPGGFTLPDGTAAPVQAELFLTHDASALYIGARLPMPQGRRPRTAVTERDGAAWTDDAFEIFLDPTGKRGSYFQLIVTAAGVQYDAIRMDAGFNAAWTAQTHIAADGWTLEVAVPFAALKADPPTDGQSWAANFAWDCTAPGQRGGSWSPMPSGLHQPAAFGTLVFSRQTAPVVLRGPKVLSTALELRGQWGPSGAPLQAEATLTSIQAGKPMPAGTVRATGGSQREPLLLTVPLPQTQGLPTAGDYRVTAQVKAGAQVLWSATAAATVKPPLTVEVEKYWLSGRLVVRLSGPTLSAAPEQLAARAKLISAAGQAAGEATGQLSAQGEASLVLPVAALAPGKYDLQVVVSGPGRAEPYAVTVALEKPEKPVWLGSRAGISDEVLPPWTPVRATGQQVACWGRTYKWGALPFPASVLTRQAEVLSGPITLVGSVGGRQLVWSGAGCKVTSARPSLAKLAGRAQAGGLTCDGTVAVEYDGMIRSDFKLTPVRQASVDNLALEIPLKAEYARYLYCWPGRWGKSSNAGALPAEGYRGPFKPFFWLGDEARGLCWFSESDRNFFHAREDEAIDIRREGQSVIFRVNLITQPQTLTKPLDYTFGFQATPVKPARPNVWDQRAGGGGSYGLESLPFFAPTVLTYPLQGNLELKQGTFECWVRPHFDPFPPRDPRGANGALNRNCVDFSFTNDVHVGYYWNIDDRSLRLYFRQGRSHPVLLATRAQWQVGEWHHIAFTWGSAARAYLDGKPAGEQVFQGLPPGELSQATITLGQPLSGFDFDEVRVSSTPHTTFDLTQPPQVAADTLLLDHLDETFTPNGRLATRPAKGTGGVVTGGIFGEGKFGRALLIPGTDRPTTYLDYLQGLGVRTLKFHEHWAMAENHPVAKRPEELHKLVAGCHAHNLQLLLYYGYLISDRAPEYDAYHADCIVTPESRENYYGEWVSIVCYNSAWQDFICDGLDRQMTEYGNDGVYLDGTSEPWGCTNTAHGCGYVKPDGSIGKTYPIFAVRHLMKRIHTIVKRHNPQGQVDVHQSSCMTIPTLAFATSYLDGEQFQGHQRGPFALDILPLDAFRCEFMGHQWGVPADFLVATNAYTRDEAMAFSLLHDVPVRGYTDVLAPLWRTFDQFGRGQADCVWVPYWQSERFVRTNGPDIKVSLYNRPGRGFIAVISNVGRTAQTAEVTFDLAALGQKGAPTARDVLGEANLTLQNGRLAAPLKSLGYIVVWVRGK